ncbi:MAG TPA: group II truncated hemoglobin [Alphaproteobacteria bacterium]|jgi:hemoglobin|nr:group II truncated hemoglobin [Alphaproteobacteria bacterium]
MTQSAAPPKTTTEAAPYQKIGEVQLRAVVDRFYDIMDTDPRATQLRAMHAVDLRPMRERLFQFLSGWLGGPPLYYQRPDHKCIMSAHGAFAIGAAERDQWMACMRRALDECGVAADVRALLDRPLALMCEAFRNR